MHLAYTVLTFCYVLYLCSILYIASLHILRVTVSVFFLFIADTSGFGNVVKVVCNCMHCATVNCFFISVLCGLAYVVWFAIRYDSC